MRIVLLRDLKLAMRVGGGFGLAIMFFLILVVLVPFGIGPDAALLSAISPGILWIGALLACLLSLDRIFSLDYHLAIAPLPLESVVLAKATAHWLTTGLPLGLISPLLGLMLGLPIEGYLWLVLSLVLGTPALSVIGTFGAALTLGLKRGGLLLSVLVLPLYGPTLIFGAEVARRGSAGIELQTPLLMLLGLSFGVMAILPFASAAVLRINLR